MRFGLTAGAAGILMLFSLMVVLADQASASDGPVCAPTTGFIPKLCIGLPLAATVKTEDVLPAPALAARPKSHGSGIAHRTELRSAVVSDREIIYVAAASLTSTSARSPSSRDELPSHNASASMLGRTVRQGTNPCCSPPDRRGVRLRSTRDIWRRGGIAQIMPTLTPIDPNDPYASSVTPRDSCAIHQPYGDAARLSPQRRAGSSGAGQPLLPSPVDDPVERLRGRRDHALRREDPRPLARGLSGRSPSRACHGCARTGQPACGR